jgi:hypothetical protein
MRRTRLSWSSALHAAVLIRLGQELGTDSRLARAVHDAIEILLAVMK